MICYKKIGIKICLGLCLTFCLTFKVSSGDLLLGVGIFGFKTHHYRGSDQTKDYFIPLPYIDYTSEHFDAEMSVLTGKIYKSKYFSMQISLNGGLDVESKKNKARIGMPPLNYTLEFGPMFIFHLLRHDTLELRIEIPIRKAFETDFSYTGSIGYTYTTYLTLKFGSIQKNNFAGEIAYGAFFADNGYHDYFYNVNSIDATSERPMYDARSGYSGRIFLLLLKKRIGSFLFFPFVRYDDLRDAVFVDSPLVKRKDYTIFGAGIYYLFF